MRPITKRWILNWLVTFLTCVVVNKITNTHWVFPVIVVPYGIWNLYDGLTRDLLDK